MKTIQSKSLTYTTIFTLLILVVTACKKDFEKPQWDTNILAPFAYTEMSIQNIVKNGAFQANPDNSMDLFIRDTLYTLEMDSLVQIEAPSFDIVKTLDSIVFDTAPIVTKITLGMIARQMVAQGNPLGSTILSSQGLPAIVPPGVVNNITGGPIAINISDVLVTANVKEGFLDISVTNGLPLAITNAVFKIANANPPAATIAQPVLSNIAAGTTALHTEDISGKLIEGNLAATILDIDLGGGFVVIDTNSAITISMKVRSVTVNSATAVFPAQNVLNDKSVNYLLNMGSVRLKTMTMKQGYVRIQVSSTVPDTLFFTYEIPGATLNGVPFKVNTKVPPSGSTTVFTYDMTGYIMSLRGKPGDDEYNGLYNTLLGSIKYTGEIVSLSLADFINVQITLEDAKPSYVEGYLGDTIIALNDSAPLNVFKNVTGGTIQFEDADPSIVVDNAFGVDGSAKVDAIVAHRGSASVALTSPLLGNSVAIGKGINGNPPTVTTTKIPLGGPGSNATALIDLMPTSIDYAGALEINPTHVIDYTQFAYAQYPVKTYMEFRLPLSLIANQLQLSDTIPLASTPQVNAALKKGKLNLIVDNGFPLDANVKAYFLDNNGMVLDSLASDQVVKRALKGSDGKVIKEERTVVYYTLSGSKITNIQEATQVNFKVTFTSESGVYTKIYNDYKIKFKLAGDIQYRVNGQ